MKYALVRIAQRVQGHLPPCHVFHSKTKVELETIGGGSLDLIRALNWLFLKVCRAQQTYLSLSSELTVWLPISCSGQVISSVCLTFLKVLMAVPFIYFTLCKEGCLALCKDLKNWIKWKNFIMTYKSFLDLYF